MYEEVSEMETLCCVCLKSTTLKCGGCGEDYYCGRACQVKHWPCHKEKCRKLRAVIAAGRLLEWIDAGKD